MMYSVTVKGKTVSKKVTVAVVELLVAVIKLNASELYYGQTYTSV
jgi:hypothetical protein